MTFFNSVSINLGLSSSDDEHVLANVSLVDDDLWREVELLLGHQWQHPHELLWGISKQSRLQT